MKKVCLILLALCVSLITWANPVDVVTANSIAKKFLQSKVEEDCKARGLQRTQSQMEVDMALVYEPATEADVSEYYVFAPSDAEGFVIVSGEDTMEPIIGYSLTDKFSIQQMPQALENLLSSYAEYIDDVRAGKVEPVSQTTESIAPIFPFITTTWNQGYPYNYYCPEINGQRTVTGCVATAMAQVMKHYEWPTAGHGNCTATLADGYGTRVSITLGEKYDWSNMKDEYYSYTETEAQAVGALMRDVGYACALEYGVNATSGYTTSALIAVLRHFDYSPSAHAIYKDYYSDAKWKELLYEELSAGHPIWYRGESQASGGHAFVFCGIDQNGGYYINWGWGGWCDGYFYLDALMPEGSNFNYAQQAIIGVKPIEKGEREEDYVAMPHIGKFEILAQSSSLSSPFVRCKIYVDNTSADALYGQVGYALYEDGEMISSDITILRGCQDLKPNWYFWSEDQLGFSNAASLSQGIREIRFFWRPNGSTEWYDALGDHCIYMKTTADGHSFFTDLKDIEDEEEKPEIPTAEIEDGCYYLKNIATGQFLTAANEWGTRASVGEHGVDVIITRQPNGKYIIDTQIGESEKHYLGLPDAFLYMDAAKIEWEIGVLENGNYVFTVDGGSTYMGYRGTVVYNNVTDPTTDEQVQWQLLTREDRIAGLKNASVDNPVDATFFILGANFGRLDYRNGIWADAPTINGNPVNYCAEKWNTTTFDVGQTITGLPNGLYELRVQGFYREGGTATPEIAANNYAAGKSVLNAMLYANEESTPLMSIMEEAKKGTAPDADYYTTSMGYVPHSQTGASNSFSEGGYQHRLQVGVTDGTLRIGIRKDAVSVYDWTCFDNFELYYCGASVLIPEYTVTFYDWDGTVLKVEMVKQGQSATAPSDPVREGYTFTGWDKSFSNVQSDLSVTATYTQNVQPEPEPEPEPELQYTIEFHAGANGWIEGTVWYDQTQKIAGYTSPLYRSQQGKVEKLRITVNRTAGNTKYFCLSEFQFFDADGQQITLAASSIASNADHNALNPTAPDGGGFAALLDGQTGTYFHSAWKNMPSEDHYLEVTLPNGGYDAFSFKMLSRARTIEGAYVYDQSHTFPGEMVLSTAVLLTEEAVKPEPEPELNNDAVYYVSQPYNGGTSWAIAEGGSLMNINTKLGLTADGADARQQFAFISNDGGKTHYLYHPAEQKYVNKDNTLSATPRDAVYFMAGAYENTFVVYFDNDHVINTNATDGLIINRWGPLSGWGMSDGGNSCSITRVEKPEPEPEPEPEVKPALDNETLYHVSQPYHEKGATSWAVARGGSGLQTNIELNVAADSKDARQQFAFISNDGGKTHYLYHPAEEKYVNMDGSLSAMPQDAVYFMAGAYDNTFVIYFDNAHFINVNQYRAVVVNDWGPGGRMGMADGGNSCAITPVEVEPEPEPEPEYTVTFYDWDGTVLKVEMVKQGQSATAPSDPVREGYTFTGWDKSFSNVQSDLSVTATYTQNVQPEPEPQPELDNDAVYYVSQPYNGGTSWAIAEGGSLMNINTKLGLTADGADARQQFAFISNDGGKTHYLYHPAEQKYVNKDNTLGTTPRDPVYFMAGAYENTFVVYFDNDHVINTNSTDGLIINRWGPLSGWGNADGGNSCAITAVGKFDITSISPTFNVGWSRVRKIVEKNGDMFFLLPDGSKYTMTGIRVE